MAKGIHRASKLAAKAIDSSPVSNATVPRRYTIVLQSVAILKEIPDMLMWTLQDTAFEWVVLNHVYQGWLYFPVETQKVSPIPSHSFSFF